MPDDRPGLSAEAERLLDARRGAVEELRALDDADHTVKDPDVIRLANARLFEQNITMRMISGEAVTSAEVRAADDLVQAALKPAGQRLKVEIAYVEGVVGIYTCKHCGQRNELEDGTYTPITPESGHCLSMS